MNRSLPNILIPAFLAGLVLLASCSEDDITKPQLPELPAILGQDVSGIDHQGATLGGWVDGHGRSTVCWFDFGNDNTYGARTPDMDADAVGGVVNMRLREAAPGMHYTITAQGGYNPQEKYMGSTRLWGDVSKRFFDNKLGVLLNMNYSKGQSGSDSYRNTFKMRLR